jgi:hypothetical protein
MSKQLRSYRNVKIIRHPGPNITPGYLYRLEITQHAKKTRPFNDSEHNVVIADGKSKEALLGFIARNNLTKHPNFKKYTISDKDGEILSTYE